MGFSRDITASAAKPAALSLEDAMRAISHLAKLLQAQGARVTALDRRLDAAELRALRAERRTVWWQAKARAASASVRALTALDTGIDPVTGFVSIGHIVLEVCATFGIDATVLLGPDKSRAVTVARQEVYLRAREVGYSFTRIGHEMRRDHSTISQGMAVALARRQKAADARFQAVGDE